MLWAQSCFHAVVHNSASRLTELSGWAPAVGRLMLHVVCALSLSLTEDRAYKNCSAFSGFCFCFMGSNSRSETVPAWKEAYAEAQWGPPGWRDSLWSSYQAWFSFITNPLDMQRTVKCCFHFGEIVWFSDSLSYIVELNICIDSRGDWANWGG